MSYSWDLAGNSAGGPNPTMRFNGSGVGVARVTVADGKGGTTTAEKQFTVGSMSGRWTGVMNGSPVQFQLTQSAERVEGRWQVNAIPGEGRLEPGSSFITDRGRVTMRIEHSFFIDATVNGQMESSGVRIVGTLTGSGFNGLPITLTKQQ